MNLVWFRNDLRINDNNSLHKACQQDNVMAVYCFDPRHYEIGEFGFKKTQNFRAKFLIETITALKASLNELNIPLFIFHGKPEKVLPKFIETHDITTVYLQKEWTTEETYVLNATKRNSPKTVVFEEVYDQFLFHPDDIPFPDFQKLPEVFTNFRKKCEKYSTVRDCSKIPLKRDQRNLISNDTHIPSLKDLGLSDFQKDSRTAFPFKGGEKEALKRVQDYFWQTKKLSFYKRTRNGLVGMDYSSKLAPWLANGSISPRTVYWEVKRFEKEIVKNQDTYWLVFELLWRDYFKYVSLKHGGNIFKIHGILGKKYQWKNTSEELEKWITGTTPEPFINANMKELERTGWMSNRGRQNVASYWAKELNQDWRIGAAYFESMLLDYDVHSNWGNWMYNSGVGNDPRDRKFNIQLQAQRYDGSGKFQKLWLQDTLF